MSATRTSGGVVWTPKNGVPGGGAGAGLVVVVHVALSMRASAGPSSARAGRISVVEGEIRLEPVQAAFAAEARLLVAAERARRVEAVERVRPHHARAQAFGYPEDPRPFLRPDSGGEPVRRVVRLLHRFVGRAERE